MISSNVVCVEMDILRQEMKVTAVKPEEWEDLAVMDMAEQILESPQQHR